MRVHLEMGGCCGKVALASSLIGDSAEESAVVLKVKNVLGARDENMQLSEQAMLPTIENCLKTHGGRHPVTALACWALSRIYKILAEQASSAEEKQRNLKQQERHLKTVNGHFQNGGDFPPLSPRDFPPIAVRMPPQPDSVKWPGYRASRIAEELASCISQQGGRAPEACAILERVHAATEAAEGATADDKIFAKIDLSGVMSQVPAKADEAIKLMTSIVDDISENPDQNAADPRLYEKMSGKLAAMLSERNKWADVEAVQRKHVAFLEKKKGPEDESLPPVMHVLCEALARQEKWAEVEPIMRRARTITSRPAMDNVLAMSLMEQGGDEKLEEAETLLRACLAQIYEKMGPDHPNTLKFRHNFVNCLEKTDKLDEAEELLRAMLQSCDKIYGAGHPLAADTVARLVEILAKLDRVDEAVALQQEWVAKWEEGGPRRVNKAPHLFLQCLVAAATQFDKLGKHELAEPIHRKLVRAVARPPGEPQQAAYPASAYLTAVKRLATNLEKQGKQAEADELRKETLVGALKRAASSKAAVSEEAATGGGEEAKI